MIVVMSPGASREQVNDIVQRIRGLGLGAHLSEGEERTIIGVVGAPLPPTLQETLEPLSGVDQVVRVSTKYKLAGWDFHPHKTVITLPGAGCARRHPAGRHRRRRRVTLIAGPCSVESEEQLLTTARGVRAAGATLLRGGAYKPRTSPYEFRGLGERGLELLAQARAETGLAIITEVMTPSDVALVGQYTDIFQIGARNAQNYLLSAARRPRHLQCRSRRALLGDAARPRHPPPDRRPPELFTFKLPDNVSFAEAAMVEPLAVGVHGATKAAVRPGDIAVVIGAGPIGLVTALSRSPPAAPASTSPTSTRPSSRSPPRSAPITPINVRARTSRRPCSTAPMAGAPTSSSNARATRAAPPASSTRSARAAASSSSAGRPSPSPTTSARRWCARPGSSTSSATPMSSRAASPCCRRAPST